MCLFDGDKSDSVNFVVFSETVKVLLHFRINLICELVFYIIAYTDVTVQILFTVKPI